MDLDERKERSAKVGRRAPKKQDSNFDIDQSLDVTNEEIPVPSARPSRDKDGPPRPSRRKGVWGEEKRRTMEELDDDRFQMKKDDSDSEPDIPVIPELEDNQEEDLTQQVAMAPNVVVNRVATYHELDNDLLRHSVFLTLDNEIDLKLLSKGLSAEHDILEDDSPWDWERLFTEVTSELLTEWERNEVKEQEEGVA